MKILFLDIDGVLNNTASTLAKVGKYVRSPGQQDMINLFFDRIRKDDDVPYGIQYTLDTIDPVAIGLLNRLLDKEPELRIVLSSSHRGFLCGDSIHRNVQFGTAWHLDMLNMYLGALGVFRHDRLIDVTPRLHVRRGIEVANWLDRRAEELGVTHHCAIDDGDDFEKHDCELVQTDATVGLTGEKYMELSRKLGISESHIIF